MAGKMFGCWPLPDFKELDEEYQLAFWQAEGNTKDEVAKIAARTVFRQLVQKRAQQWSGKYLPLGAYRQQGFDVDRIEENCDDYYFDKVLGWVYRVWLTSEQYTYGRRC